MAVKVMGNPGQLLVMLDAILTAVVILPLPPTVMVNVDEVAVEGDAQAALEVITTPTVWPLVSELVVNVLVVVLLPTLLPFTCH